MSTADRQHWDTVYRERETEPFPDPDPLLFQYTPPAPRGSASRALDLAGGMGQNGLWLAAQGYSVDVMDISRVALSRGQAEAAQRRLRHLNFLLVDLDDVTFEPNTYSLVCAFRFLSRDLISPLRAAVAPGGRIIYETFNIRHLDIAPSFNPAYLLHRGELAGYFADWRILYTADHRSVSQVVALKPET